MKDATKEKLDLLKLTEISPDDMEYGKWYTVVDGIICKSEFTSERDIKWMYGNAVRKLSDDEIILKRDVIEKSNPFGHSILEKVQSRLDTAKLSNPLPT